MSLFVNKDGSRKNPMVMMVFFMTMLFVVVFWALYALLAKPLFAYVVLGSEAFSAGMYCTIIAVIGTAICCLLFYCSNKRLAPAGFVGLGVFMLACYIGYLGNRCINRIRWI